MEKRENLSNAFFVNILLDFLIYSEQFIVEILSKFISCDYNKILKILLYLLQITVT